MFPSSTGAAKAISKVVLSLGGKYDLDLKNPDGKKEDWKTGKQMSFHNQEWSEKYTFVPIGDHLDRDDRATYSGFMALGGKVTQIMGDGLLVTITKLIEQTLEVSTLNGWGVMVSRPHWQHGRHVL